MKLGRPITTRSLITLSTVNSLFLTHKRKNVHVLKLESNFGLPRLGEIIYFFPPTDKHTELDFY
jgi:hypothetical protein